MSIETSINGGVFSIVLAREEKKNAITAAMYQAMADAIKQAEADPAARVILIRGSEKTFTAGNDLEDFLKRPPSSEEFAVQQFIRGLSHAAKPVVAAVAGPAVGIGTTMLLHCDLVYAADNARLSVPFTQLGLCPEFASSLLLPRLTGYQRAAEKVLLGEPFLAAEAQEMGLVNKVLPAAELMAFATAQAAKLAALPPASVRTSKKLMRGPLMESIKAQIAEENKAFGAILNAPEAKEAFTAFFEKRKPDFSRFS
ncbi:MAG: enoyl-CoA hydratase [Candidatus Protistobacter heckmanni]|nr:enoyl-CoA hydratase [Candidatus Protistobacter heckmanni]